MNDVVRQVSIQVIVIKCYCIKHQINHIVLQTLPHIAGGDLKVEKISSKTTCPLSISTQRETQTLLLGEAGAKQHTAR